jgi:hypothetical protein
MENGPLTYDTVYTLAKKKNIPVFVDAAAEMLTIPNAHLQRGATFVGYSGGKCLRAPQCSGLILGRKDLLQAAWVSSAPHHGHGRAMKIGKEEMVGLLAAVEMWVQRDHQKEDQTWTQWMQTISDRVTKVDGVSAVIRQPKSIDNHSPSLAITWDPAKLGITGGQLADLLWTTEPRIAVGRVPDAPDKSGVSITAYMMHPDEGRVSLATCTRFFGKTSRLAPGSLPAVRRVSPDAGMCRSSLPPALPLSHSTSSSKAISLSGRIKAISWRATLQVRFRAMTFLFRAVWERSTARRCLIVSRGNSKATGCRARSIWANTWERNGPQRVMFSAGIQAET